MGVDPVFLLRILARSDACRGLNDLPLAAGIFEQSFEEAFIPGAVDDQQFASLDLCEVLRRRLITVRVRTDGEKRFNRQAVTREVARDIRQKGGGGQYRRSRRG